ncbi:MAG: hypothetical protein ACPG8W_01985 [Candidatus Promineifilaceae bacterium]
MSYTIKEQKQVTATVEQTRNAALKAVAGLEGKLLKQDSTTIVVQFHKTILGKVLGDRTHLTVALSPSTDGCSVQTTIYPLNAVGQKLLFGARKGVSRTVLTWFFAHLDHHLKKLI